MSASSQSHLNDLVVILWILTHYFLFIICASQCAKDPSCLCSEGTGGNLIVDCSRKTLYTMPEEMPSNTYDLRLEKNEIHAIPLGYFDNLTELTYLRIQNNKLTELHAGLFDYNINLVEINLNDNLLTEVPGNLFAILPKLNWLYMERNKLDCGCPVEDFRAWLLSVVTTLTFDAYCADGTAIIDVPTASFDVCIVTTTPTTTTTTTTSTTTTTPTTTSTTTTSTTTALLTTDDPTQSTVIQLPTGSSLIPFIISLLLLAIIIISCVSVLVMNHKEKAKSGKVHPDNNECGKTE